jgi:hypothetical protein
MDFKVGDRVRVCLPEDMRPLRWDSVQALMDGRMGTIVQCVSGFWVVSFDQPIEIVPGLSKSTAGKSGGASASRVASEDDGRSRFASRPL